jgi:hypothetical protein
MDVQIKNHEPHNHFLTKHDSHGYSPVFAVTGYHVVGHVSIIVAGFRAGRVPAWFAAALTFSAFAGCATSGEGDCQPNLHNGTHAPQVFTFAEDHDDIPGFKGF